MLNHLLIIYYKKYDSLMIHIFFFLITDLSNKCIIFVILKKEHVYNKNA